MAYFVTVAFDIHEGTFEDYEKVYAEFLKIGLSRFLTSDGGNQLRLPDSTTAGEFSGASAAAVRDSVAQQAESVFTRNRLKGKIFVAVGGDWAWGMRNP